MWNIVNCSSSSVKPLARYTQWPQFLHIRRSHHQHNVVDDVVVVAIFNIIITNDIIFPKQHLTCKHNWNTSLGHWPLFLQLSSSSPLLASLFIPGPPTCAHCNKAIFDGTILQVSGQYWHNSCLQCHVCRKRLDGCCHVKDNRFYCRDDFVR